MKIPSELLTVNNITVTGDEKSQIINVKITPELKRASEELIKAAQETGKNIAEDLHVYLSKWEGKVLNQSTYDAIQNDVLNYYTRLNESGVFGH